MKQKPRRDEKLEQTERGAEIDEVGCGKRVWIGIRDFAVVVKLDEMGTGMA
jgi:hypothetical protein